MLTCRLFSHVVLLPIVLALAIALSTLTILWALQPRQTGEAATTATDLVTTNVGLAADGLQLDGNLVAFLVSESLQGSTDLNGDGDSLDRVLHVFNYATNITTNVGLASGSNLKLDGNLVAFGVDETGQNGSDLNSDGDSDDFVLHVFDASTTTTVNVGLAFRTSNPPELDGHLVAVGVSERDQGGSDLNGDGDASDVVLHVFDVSTNTTTNLALADGGGFRAKGDLVAFSVRESDQGNADLNGDGDSLDRVLHVFNHATNITTNLGLASNGHEIDGNLVALNVSERDQGGTDLNSDGDSSDFVLHVFDASTGVTTNVGLASNGLKIDGSLVAFEVCEFCQDTTDLNGDGDNFDRVLHIFDVSTGTTTNVGLAIIGFTIDGNLVALNVSEFSHGSTDLNGDGDSLDRVLHVFNYATNITTNLGLASNGDEIDGNLVALNVSERDQGGSDLNGDGDSSDFVLHVFDASTGVTTNVGLVASIFNLDGNLVAFNVAEFGQGDTDLNDDGDTGDAVAHVFDASTGTTRNLGLGASNDVLGPRLDGARMAFLVSESDQGGTDLNGDGDNTDSVLHVTDLRGVVDLSITKTASPDPVVVGSDLTYTLVATNASTGSAATGVFLTDELPASVVLVSGTTTQGTCSEDGGVVTCDLGTLDPEASATVEIVVTPTLEGEITNTASVTSDVFDPNPDNNSATEVTTVVGVCTLELTPSYDSGTLTVEILVGTLTPATANLWAISQSNIIPIVTGQPVPITDPPTTRSISRTVPSQGVIGLLATLTTPEDGIICSDFQTVNTGAAP